jgi:hypothetical protein
MSTMKANAVPPPLRHRVMGYLIPVEPDRLIVNWDGSCWVHQGAPTTTEKARRPEDFTDTIAVLL